jgi:hypothetical protein
MLASDCPYFVEYQAKKEKESLIVPERKETVYARCARSPGYVLVNTDTNGFCILFKLATLQQASTSVSSQVQLNKKVRKKA